MLKICNLSVYMNGHKDALMQYYFTCYSKRILESDGQPENWNN